MFQIGMYRFYYCAYWGRKTGVGSQKLLKTELFLQFG